MTSKNDRTAPVALTVLIRQVPHPSRFAWEVDEVEGAVLVDQLKSLDWFGRSAKFHSKVEPGLLNKVRQYVAVLLASR